MNGVGFVMMVSLAVAGVGSGAGDFRWNQTSGGCGKAGQVPLPVTEGAPHVRFRELLVGGEVAG